MTELDRLVLACLITGITGAFIAAIMVFTPYTGHGPVGRGFDRTPILPDAYRPGISGEDSGQVTADSWVIPLGTPVNVVIPKSNPFKALPQRLLAEADKYIGLRAQDIGVRTNLWCAAAINKFLKNIGLRGTGSDLAASFANWGHPSKIIPGAIAVKPRRGGNHVVVVKKVLPRGRILAISPNSGGKVRELVYLASVFYAVRTAGL